MNLAELLFGQIPEAVYFALFLILTKSLKEKRTLFIILMTIEYVLCLNVQLFSTWSHIVYTFLVFITLKLTYKEKAHTTDVFTFGIASLVIMCTSTISFLLFMPHTILVLIFSRILLFIFLIIFRNKLSKIQNLYKKLWNRNDKINTKMKSTTFRSLNIVIFNIMFYIINLGMIYAIFIKK